MAPARDQRDLGARGDGCVKGILPFASPATRPPLASHRALCIVPQATSYNLVLFCPNLLHTSYSNASTSAFAPRTPRHDLFVSQLTADLASRCNASSITEAQAATQRRNAKQPGDRHKRRYVRGACRTKPVYCIEGGNRTHPSPTSMASGLKWQVRTHIYVQWCTDEIRSSTRVRTFSEW